MLQPLSYRHIAGHFVPGIVMFIAVILISDILTNFAILTRIKTNSNNILVFGMIFLVASFTLGLVVDGIRYGIEDIIMKKSERKQQSNLYVGVNEKNFEFFKYVYENAYPFYQLYSNMCISLVVLSCALPWYLSLKILDQKYEHTWWITFVIIFITILLHVLAAGRSLRKYREAIKCFFSSNVTLQKGGETLD